MVYLKVGIYRGDDGLYMLQRAFPREYINYASLTWVRCTFLWWSLNTSEQTREKSVGNQLLYHVHLNVVLIQDGVL